MTRRKLPPVHPGEILLEEFLSPLRVSQYRLAKETSPYLLLHAHNPVDWYPWGPEALAKAKVGATKLSEMIKARTIVAKRLDGKKILIDLNSIDIHEGRALGQLELKIDCVQPAIDA